MADETKTPAETPVAKIKVTARKQGQYADRWREVLICEPLDANSVHVAAGPIVVSAALFPQAKPGDVLTLTVAAAAK